MTEPEIREYLGLIETDTLDPAVIERMKDLPYPQTNAEHINTYRTYLLTRDEDYGTLQAEHNAAADRDPDWPGHCD